MSVNLINNAIVTYRNNVELLLQQKGSKLEGMVMGGSHTGEQASPVDQIGAVTASRINGRFEDMPRTDAPFDKRWVFPQPWDINQMVDTFDKLRVGIEPEGALVQNALYAMGRAKDDVIIDAFFADAKTGKTGATTTSFVSGQSVSVSVGGTTSGLNVPKLREVVRLALVNEIDQDDQLMASITSKQHDDLLNEVQVVNLDYNERPVLMDGRVKRFVGIDFNTIERLKTGTDDAAGTSRAIPVWVKSGMYLGTWMEINIKISQRDDLRAQPWQAYAKGDFDATRLDEKKVFRIWCR